jgi:hypothetical protein
LKGDSMKRILSIFIILLVLCLPTTAFSICGPAPTPGGDWVFPGGFCDNILLVCPTSEYTTIGAAMNAADGWDTIYVAEGTYSEAVVFSQNNITLRAFGSPENTIITQAAGTVVDFNTKYGCTLDGFTVSLSAATSTNDEIIYQNNNSATAYNTIKNCIITGQNAGGSTFGLYGIRVDDGNFELFHNRISIIQTNESAVYAIWNTAAHTSKYIGNTLVIDQQSTGGHMVSGLHHNAGAGSIMYCDENIEIITSTHTGAGAGYAVYAAAETNYVNNNIINAVTSGTGLMYGLYAGGTTSRFIANMIHTATDDSDGQWGNFAIGTIYAHGNIVTGDGVMGTGGTIYEGGNQINATVSINGVPYTFPTDNGDAGEKLQTDGAGTLSWEAGGGGEYVILTDTDIAGDAITASQATPNTIIFGDKAGAMDYDLPAAAAGLSVRLKVTTANTGTLDSIGDDVIHLLDGTAITAANAIDLDGTAGSYVWLVAKDATNWWIMGQVGAVIDGGAD